MGKWIARLLAVLLLLGAAGAGAFFYGLSLFDGPGPLAQASVVIIPKGAGLQGAARSLEQAGVISDARLFDFGVWRYHETGRLKAGEYAFTPHQSGHDIMEMMRKGETLVHKLTIPEGSTVKQVVEILTAEEALAGNVGPLPPEGSLLPETYHFSRDDSRAEILTRMERAMTQTLETLWAGRVGNLPLKNRHEALILASIVERETALTTERPHIAAIFLNRLKRGMKLQSDPTTIYGLSDGLGVLDRPLTHQDLESALPWNTYVIPGLPPSPIANPGKAALQAVLHPDNSDDLYFVADGSGGHAFAKTLTDHNRNVSQWRALEKSGSPK